jgi:hypothetical protein
MNAKRFLIFVGKMTVVLVVTTFVVGVVAYPLLTKDLLEDPVLGHLAGSSGIIEGLYMMHPEFVTPEILLRSLPEPIVQGVLIAAWLAKWMPGRPQEQTRS